MTAPTSLELQLRNAAKRALVDLRDSHTHYEWQAGQCNGCHTCRRSIPAIEGALEAFDAEHQGVLA